MTDDAGPGFDQLLPDDILDAVESAGHEATGGLLPLNSYENRVYRVDIFDAPPLVAKFYRNGRWSDAQLREVWDLVLDMSGETFQLRPVDDARYVLSRLGPWCAREVASALTDEDPWLRTAGMKHTGAWPP